jgi:hypothetical protein
VVVFLPRNRSRISPSPLTSSLLLIGDGTLLHALSASRAWPLARSRCVATSALRQAVADGARGCMCEMSHVM